tara:strand:- start:1395 stop:1622 length:228 start_codon:yes stop_codon:yes gene_type:complete
MDPWSPQAQAMNRAVTKASGMLFPYFVNAKYKRHWEDQVLRRWLDDPAETPDVQASRRSPNYKETYAKNPPKEGY